MTEMFWQKHSSQLWDFSDRDMDIVRYFANGKSFKLDDRIANARIFSREVEHSEETLEILEDDISFDEAFHVKHLLGQI